MNQAIKLEAKLTEEARAKLESQAERAGSKSITEHLQTVFATYEALLETHEKGGTVELVDAEGDRARLQFLPAAQESPSSTPVIYVFAAPTYKQAAAMERSYREHRDVAGPAKYYTWSKTGPPNQIKGLRGPLKLVKHRMVENERELLSAVHRIPGSDFGTAMVEVWDEPCCPELVPEMKRNLE